ncbi:flagellar protein [Lachnospiraceae bacterium oral taxon 500]|nr:flagellar protein [Lachnospiraceae bacterium oral taxon 500]
MDVRNCVRCGKIFNYITGYPICADCKKELEQKFAEVKQYLRENPHSSIQEVADANQVDIRQIKQWIREERITFAEDSMVGIECERCGTTIRTGRFCAKCKSEMAGNLESFTQSATPAESPLKSSLPPQTEEDRLRFRR